MFHFVSMHEGFKMSETLTTRILKKLNDPEVFEKLIASDGELGDYFGKSVVASADGLTVVVSTPYANDKGPDSGAAYVFTKQANGNYLQTQKLLASDGAVQDYFGCSVDISADGLTVVVGAFSGGDEGNGSGAAYIFTKQPDGSFSETQKLLASDGTTYDYFGFSIATSGDGSTVIVGAYGDEDKGIDSGSAYIFTKQSNGSYLQTQKLVAADGTPLDAFGYNAAVAADGLTVVVSAFKDGAFHVDDKGTNSGSAYVFTKQADGSYLETQKLVISDRTTHDRFGHSLAVSRDGSTVVIGAYRDDDKGVDSGSAYILTKQANGSYLQTQKLVASDGATDDRFGTSVAVTGNGATVVVGASWGNVKGNKTGSAYVFTKQSDGVYLQTQKLLASDGTVTDQFGLSVAISTTSVVIGAPYHLGKGAVYVY